MSFKHRWWLPWRPSWPMWLRIYYTLVMVSAVVAGIFGLYLIATDQTPY